VTQGASYSLFETSNEEEEIKERSEAGMEGNRPKPRRAFQANFLDWDSRAITHVGGAHCGLSGDRMPLAVEAF
jgi:hypothetical protein